MVRTHVREIRIGISYRASDRSVIHFDPVVNLSRSVLSGEDLS